MVYDALNSELTLALLLIGTYMAYLFALHMVRVRDRELSMCKRGLNMLAAMIHIEHEENLRLMGLLAENKGHEYVER